MDKFPSLGSGFWEAAKAGGDPLRRSRSGSKSQSAFKQAEKRRRSPSAVEGWGGSSMSGSAILPSQPSQAASQRAPSISPEGSVASVVPLAYLPTWPHHMPWVETHFKALVVGKEFGAANFYADAVRDLEKTEPIETGKCVRTYDGTWVLTTDNLWTFVRFECWRATVQSVLNIELERLLVALTDLVQASAPDGEADAGKGVHKAWLKAYGQVRAAMAAIGTVCTMTNICKAAATALEDPVFFKHLDGSRRLLSFANGVVDLKAPDLEVRARTAHDFLSYALPYEFDPAADQTDIRAFVDAIMSSAEARATLQATVGYWATGETTEKRFWQLSTQPNSGKTSFVEIISNALGKYGPMGAAPVSELLESTHFEDSLASALGSHPAPRILIFDETGADCHLKEAFINLATSGSSDIRLQCARKHKQGELVTLQAKIVFCSNHVLSINASSSGTAFRNTCPPFDSTFVSADGYDPKMAAAGYKVRDDALCARLKSDAGRAGVMAWIVDGARQFYSQGIPRSARWDRYSLELLVKGDPYLKFIAETHVPTGCATDRVSLFAIVEQFLRGKGAGASRKVDDGIAAALASLAPLVTPVLWQEPMPFYGSGAVPPDHPQLVVSGFRGLRRRVFADLSYYECLEAARLRLASTEEADEVPEKANPES